MADTSRFKPNEELIAQALSDQAEIERTNRFSTSDEARQKQDTPFADELVESEAEDGDPLLPPSAPQRDQR